jgi:lipoprotein-anchoring transpeptidase ErfK/SrfK
MKARRTDRAGRSSGLPSICGPAALALLAGLLSAPLATAAGQAARADGATIAAARLSGHSASCPPAATPSVASASAPAPTVRYPTVTVNAGTVTVQALVDAHGEPASVFVRFGESPGYARCSAAMRLPGRKGQTRVSMSLSALIPRATYHFELGASAAGATTYGRPETFTAPPATIPAGVRVGPLELGGATRTEAVRRLDAFLAAPLRFAFENVYWRAPRALLGAEIDAPATIARALAARPGSHLRLELSIDHERLRTYLDGVNSRFAHPAGAASVHLVGTRAIVAPGRPSVDVDIKRMAAAVQTALLSGVSERLRLIVEPTPTGQPTAAKAVVVRLGSQTLTAYLNGKAVLKTPVTTGRAALPTPVGSYRVIFRASPFVFNSPWPAGSPFWYPPTPVTWAMDFYGGDFLHDDPGEPSDAFGEGSEYGPYASHGCVHVPHDAMAFLYHWLPVGAQVVVSQD